MKYNILYLCFTELYLYRFPFSAAEQNDSGNRNSRFRQQYGDKNARWSKTSSNGKDIRQWHLEQPEPKNIDDCRGPCITRTIKRICNNHTNAVQDIPDTDNFQGARCMFHYHG